MSNTAVCLGILGSSLHGKKGSLKSNKSSKLWNQLLPPGPGSSSTSLSPSHARPRQRRGCLPQIGLGNSTVTSSFSQQLLLECQISLILIEQWGRFSFRLSGSGDKFEHSTKPSASQAPQLLCGLAAVKHLDVGPAWHSAARCCFTWCAFCSPPRPGTTWVQAELSMHKHTVASQLLH